MAVDPPVIARLRAYLAEHVPAPLAVSAKSTQYWFDEESAAYNEIDVRLGEVFLVVIVLGALPSEEFIAQLWHRYALEVWLVDTIEQTVQVIPRDGVIRVFEAGEIVRSPRLPQVALPVATLFGIAN